MVKVRKKSTLWIIVTAACIPIAIFIVVLTMGIINISIAKGFAVEITDDFRYAEENDSMQAVYKDVQTRVTADNAESIASEMNLARFMKYKGEIESSEYIEIRFGNGNILFVYSFEDRGVIYRYSRPGEKDIVLTNIEISRFITYERLVSTEWGNVMLRNEQID